MCGFTVALFTVLYLGGAIHAYTIVSALHAGGDNRGSILKVFYCYVSERKNKLNGGEPLSI